MSGLATKAFKKVLNGADCLPAGGIPGQLVVKASDRDFDFTFVNQTPAPDPGSGGGSGNLDGGTATSNYGGISPIDGGNA